LFFGLAFFQKSERVRAAPEGAAFLFCQAFFFVPTVAKKKASNEWHKRHGYRETDRRGRRSLQVYTMRTLIRERDGYRETNMKL